MMDGDVFAELRDALRRFAAERDWDQFHSPKNLSMALSVEAGELLERFQWLSEAKVAFAVVGRASACRGGDGRRAALSDSTRR